MATERLPMRHIREILRLKLCLQRSHRETARSLAISPGAVASVLAGPVTAIGLTWETVDGLSDEALEERLYGPNIPERMAHPLPDAAWIHTELRRAGVTLELVQLEYLQQHPDGYRYSAFCRHYGEWLGRQRLSMRQLHKTMTSSLSISQGRSRRSPPTATDARAHDRRPSGRRVHAARGNTCWVVAWAPIRSRNEPSDKPGTIQCIGVSL